VKVNSRSRSMLSPVRVSSVVCLSVSLLSVCNACAPYLVGWNFRQYFRPFGTLTIR